LPHQAENISYDESLIDDRNARPLTIAFATIVMVWMLAFGIVLVSAQIGVQSHHNGGKRGVDREVISQLDRQSSWNCRLA
jgi:hypothetical protein